MTCARTQLVTIPLCRLHLCACQIPLYAVAIINVLFVHGRSVYDISAGHATLQCAVYVQSAV